MFEPIFIVLRHGRKTLTFYTQFSSLIYEKWCQEMFFKQLIKDKFHIQNLKMTIMSLKNLRT